MKDLILRFVLVAGAVLCVALAGGASLRGL